MIELHLDCIGRVPAGKQHHDEIAKRVTDALRARFRPELLNRIQDIVVFNSLGLEEIEGIVDIQLERLGRRLAERDIHIELSPEAKKQLATQGYDPVYGARPLERTITRMIENPLATRIIEGEIQPGDRVRVDLQHNDFVIVKESPPLKEPS